MSIASRSRDLRARHKVKKEDFTANYTDFEQLKWRMGKLLVVLALSLAQPSPRYIYMTVLGFAKLHSLVEDPGNGFSFPAHSQVFSYTLVFGEWGTLSGNQEMTSQLHHHYLYHESLPLSNHHHTIYFVNYYDMD